MMFLGAGYAVLSVTFVLVMLLGLGLKRTLKSTTLNMEPRWLFAGFLLGGFTSVMAFLLTPTDPFANRGMAGAFACTVIIGLLTLWIGIPPLRKVALVVMMVRARQDSDYQPFIGGARD